MSDLEQMTDLNRITDLGEQLYLALARPAINHAGRNFIGFARGKETLLGGEFRKPVPPDDAADLIKRLEVARPNRNFETENFVQCYLDTTLRRVDPDRSSSLYSFFQVVTFRPAWSRFGAAVDMNIKVGDERRDWCKDLSLLTDVQIFTGGEVTLPPAYFGLSNIASSSSALIMALVFSDGTLLPLSYTVDQSRACLERQRTEVIKAWRAALALKQPLAAAAAKNEITKRTVFDPNDLKIEFERKHWAVKEQVTKEGRYIAPESDTSYCITVRNKSSKAIDLIKADVGLIHDGESFVEGTPFTYDGLWGSQTDYTTTRFKHSGIEQFTINIRPVPANGWSFQALRARDFNRSRVARSDKWVLLRVYGQCEGHTFVTHVTQGYLEPPETIEAETRTETRRSSLYPRHAPPALG